MKVDFRFVQLEIPGMGEFLAKLKTQSQSTKITLLQPSNNICTNPEIQTAFQQLEIPGMEEFLAKLKTQPETADLSEYDDTMTISRTFDNFAA